MMGKETQRNRILRALKGGGLVPVRELIKIAHQYNARIFELRGEGHKIVSKRHPANSEITYYTLVEEKAPDRE